jgi:hypothetical protein
MCTGFCTEDVPPSPNVHAHVTGEFVDVSEKPTLSGALPEVTFDVNEATGGEALVTVI